MSAETDFPATAKLTYAWERLNTRGNREGTAGVNEVRQPLETEWSAFVPLDLGVPVLTVDTSNDHQLSLAHPAVSLIAGTVTPFGTPEHRP